nr:MAG TPA: hypothetical protein [Caudoviricetes sp.]
MTLRLYHFLIKKSIIGVMKNERIFKINGLERWKSNNCL